MASLKVEKAVSCWKVDRHCPTSATFVTSSIQALYCKRGMLQRRLQTGVRETLLLDVVVPGAYQNDSSMYVSSVELLSVHLVKFYMVGSYMENLKKLQNGQNWRVSTCARMGACPDNTVFTNCCCSPNTLKLQY